jgi:hypothetical protein
VEQALLEFSELPVVATGYFSEAGTEDRRDDVEGYLSVMAMKLKN